MQEESKPFHTHATPWCIAALAQHLTPKPGCFCGGALRCTRLSACTRKATLPLVRLPPPPLSALCPACLAKAAPVPLFRRTPAVRAARASPSQCTRPTSTVFLPPTRLQGATRGLLLHLTTHVSPHAIAEHARATPSPPSSSASAGSGAGVHARAAPCSAPVRVAVELLVLCARWGVQPSPNWLVGLLEVRGHGVWGGGLARVCTYTGL